MISATAQSISTFVIQGFCQPAALARWQTLATINTGQRIVSLLVALPNGELLTSGDDDSIKRWSVEAVAKRGCLDLQDHQVLRDPQTPPQRAARDTCRRLGVLKR